MYTKVETPNRGERHTRGVFVFASLIFSACLEAIHHHTRCKASHTRSGVRVRATKVRVQAYCITGGAERMGETIGGSDVVVWSRPPVGRRVRGVLRSLFCTHTDGYQQSGG